MRCPDMGEWSALTYVPGLSVRDRESQCTQDFCQNIAPFWAVAVWYKWVRVLPEDAV